MPPSRMLFAAVAFLLFLIAPALLLAGSVTIVSPSSSTTSSPVHVVADFQHSSPIVGIKVYIDHVGFAQANATPLDTHFTMAEGTHLLTVKAWQANGTVIASSKYVNVSNGSPPPDTVPSGALVFRKIEERSGWYTYPDQGHPICSTKPKLVSTPSLDGISGMFFLGPQGQFNNCLWPISLGSSTTATHLQMDAHYRLSNPAYSQGVEFSANHHIGTRWYKFSVQCSYSKGIFSVFDVPAGHWSPTSIPCRRPATGSWDRLTVQAAIISGRAVFQSLTLNGVKYTINKSFAPVSKGSSYSIGAHFQMNGDVSAHAYQAYVDQFTVSAW
ncbi:MAG TPA: hypothetical protein VFA76_16250 [Terriglobales bacterium]|nr:hypothetical protein [Terriglobales bacterium]